MTSEQFQNIPEELRGRGWLQYYLSPDPKKPDKKPRKHPSVKYATPEDREANLRPLGSLLERPPQKNGGVQRHVDRAEGFTYVDIDKVRNAETGEVEPWAQDLIEWLNTYCEVSASGTGFHLVCRGTLPEDYHTDPDKVEIYAGNIPNKLIAFTGNRYELQCRIEDRQAKLNQLLHRAKQREFNREHPSELQHWRERFHTVDELPDGDIRFLIENVLPEGVSFVGALSGAGKTWFCLSMARALTTGKKFLGNWAVQEPVEVLYLCPEMNAKTFKKRCRLFGIRERFHCQTISDGVPLNLSDPLLAEAIRELKPVVFLDTAIRFAGAEDENSSSQNAHGLAAAVFALLHLGAQAVVCLHHRAKDTAKQEELTLENTLRGTGDLGAMCDSVWGLQYDKGTGDPQWAKDSKKLVRLTVCCVKARDFPVPDGFRIQLSPHIEQIGDFGVLADDTSNPQKQSEIENLDSAISANPTASVRQLDAATGICRNRIPKLAQEAGWFQEGKGWERKLPLA